MHFSFLGEFSHNIDEKGRLALPGKLRDELQKSSCPDVVVIHPSRDGYLSLYPVEQWTKLEETVNAVADTAMRLALSREYNGRAEKVTLDKAGRISLLQKHREAACLEREVLVLGGMFKIEVWERSRLEEQRAKEAALVAEALGSVSLPL